MTNQQMINKINSIEDDFGINISFCYAKLYKENGIAFIKSFIKYDSIKMACAYMRKAYKRQGAWNELKKKDFTEYVNRFKLEDRWKSVMNDTLMIIYNLINK